MILSAERKALPHFDPIMKNQAHHLIEEAIGFTVVSEKRHRGIARLESKVEIPSIGLFFLLIFLA